MKIQSMVVNTYQKNPFTRNLYQLADRDLSVPLHLLPPGMKEIEVRYFFFRSESLLPYLPETGRFR